MALCAITRATAARRAAALVAAVLLMAALPATAAARLPDTTSGVHIGVAFGYGDALQSPGPVEYVWGAGAPSAATHTEAYIPFHVDWVLARNSHDLRWYKRHHPGWVAYRCDRKTPAYYPGVPNVPLDFNNPWVRRYQLNKASELLAAGYDGIDVDNYTLTNYQARCGSYRHGRWHSFGYRQGDRFSPGDPKLVHDMIDWLRYMSVHLHARYPGRGLTVNSSVQLNGGLRYSKLMVPYIDADFDEGGFTQYGAGPLAGDPWREQVQWAEYLRARGKGLILTAMLNDASEAAVSPAQLTWAVANYLLVKGDQTFTYIYPSSTAYGTFTDRPIYHLDIGRPLGTRVSWNGVEMRDFSGGAVIVNPSPTQAYTIAVTGDYHDPAGDPVSSLTLAPASASILLGSTGPGLQAGATVTSTGP
jgi:hypothetical protein